MVWQGSLPYYGLFSVDPSGLSNHQTRKTEKYSGVIRPGRVEKNCVLCQQTRKGGIFEMFRTGNSGFMYI